MPYDADQLAGAGLLSWAEHISDVMFQSQSEIVHRQASFLLESNYLRINPKLDFAMALGDTDKIDSLQNHMDITSEHEPFLDAHLM